MEYQDFLWSINSASRPLPPPSPFPLYLFLSLPAYHLLKEGVGVEPSHTTVRKLFLCNSFNTLKWGGYWVGVYCIVYSKFDYDHGASLAVYIYTTVYST